MTAPQGRTALVESLIERTHAEIWIEHDLLGYGRLKKAPAHYD